VVLKALSDFPESRSKKDVPRLLRSQAEHYFGSLPKAMIALKKDRRLSRGWSKSKIITLLSRMHRSKRPLAYATARRNVPRARQRRRSLLRKLG
jgi:hypothetical protein